MNRLRHLRWYLLAAALIVGLTWKPEPTRAGGGPIVACPTCKYIVAQGKLTGRMNPDYLAEPYPFKNLVVTVKLNDGTAHTFPIGTPSTYSSGMSFNILVTGEISSNVSRVNLAWTSDDEDAVLQDNITLVQ